MSVLAAVLVAIGLAFFVAGTVGVLRLPDVYTRLHAATKADNLGLGFTGLGMLIEAGIGPQAFKILAAWLLVLVSSAVASHLIARDAYRRGVIPWRRP